MLLPTCNKKFLSAYKAVILAFLKIDRRGPAFQANFSGQFQFHIVDCLWWG